MRRGFAIHRIAGREAGRWIGRRGRRVLSASHARFQGHPMKESETVDLTRRESYRFWSEVTTRFADIDELGHLNNLAAAVLLRDRASRVPRVAVPPSRDGAGCRLPGRQDKRGLPHPGPLSRRRRGGHDRDSNRAHVVYPGPGMLQGRNLLRHRRDGDGVCELRRALSLALPDELRSGLEAHAPSPSSAPI